MNLSTPSWLKKSQGLACALALLGLQALATLPAHALSAGDNAPAFSLPRQGGEALKLEQLRGQVVYLDFWASWCGPCKQSFPWMNQMQAKYAAKGFRVVGINVDNKAALVDAFLKQTPAQFEVLLDPSGSTPKSYGIKGMPSSFLIGRDGKVMHAHVGFRDEQRAELEAQIQSALAQSPR